MATGYEILDKNGAYEEGNPSKADAIGYLPEELRQILSSMTLRSFEKTTFKKVGAKWVKNGSVNAVPDISLWD